MENPHENPSRRRALTGGGEPVFWTIIIGLLFLYFGFFAPFIPWDNDPQSQKIAIHVFNWMARIVGVSLLVVAALAYAKIRFATLLNCIVATIAAAGCIGAGAVWVINGYTMGFLVIIFGVINAGTARAAWLAWRPAALQ